jgi:hypothetical protein
MEYKDYTTSIDKLSETLGKYGVAVIPNVLSQQEIADMKKGMWDTLGTITKKFDKPIKEKDQKSWNSFYDLLPLHSMLIQHHGIGHAQFVWDLRQNPNIALIFAKLWKCKPEDLLTSFDGLSIHFPPEVTGKGWYKGNDWLHTDQSYTRNNFECAQGFVSGFDINEYDATLTILEGSHKYHKECAEKFNLTSKTDWYKLNDEEIKFYKDKSCKQYCVKCPAGGMVFWDSRTIHAGIEPQKDRKKQNTRLVVYICQTPRKLASKTDLEKKQLAFKELRMTSHWPHKIKLFPLNPRTYGSADLPNTTPLPKPKLSDFGLKLAGF